MFDTFVSLRQKWRVAINLKIIAVPNLFRGISRKFSIVAALNKQQVKSVLSIKITTSSLLALVGLQFNDGQGVLVNKCDTKTTRISLKKKKY